MSPNYFIHWILKQSPCLELILYAVRARNSSLSLENRLDFYLNCSLHSMFCAAVIVVQRGNCTTSLNLSFVFKKVLKSAKICEFLSIRKMGEKMIQGVLQEGTGGKVWHYLWHIGAWVGIMDMDNGLHFSNIYFWLFISICRISLLLRAHLPRHIVTKVFVFIWLTTYKKNMFQMENIYFPVLRPIIVIDFVCPIFSTNLNLIWLNCFCDEILCRYIEHRVAA